MHHQHDIVARNAKEGNGTNGMSERKKLTNARPGVRILHPHLCASYLINVLDANAQKQMEKG